MRAFALLLLSACAAEPGGSDPLPRRTDRVRLHARISTEPSETRVNTYFPSVDSRSGLIFRVVKVVEGSFPHTFVVCSTHSGSMLKTLLFFSNDSNDPSELGRETSLFELTLVWDEAEHLYRLDAFRVVER